MAENELVRIQLSIMQRVAEPRLTKTPFSTVLVTREDYNCFLGEKQQRKCKLRCSLTSEHQYHRRYRHRPATLGTFIVRNTIMHLMFTILDS